MHPTLTRFFVCGATAWSVGLALPAQAGEFDISGFATIAAGRTLSGSRTDPVYGYSCPCFVADYGHGAIYGPKWSVKQESKVGVQGTYTFTPTLSATAQVVGRGVDGVKAYLEWAYLSYDVSPSWTLQLGRKRLPIYYYSDFQDVGYAYTWVRPPPDIYGWEVVNYNGLNATYRGDWSGWAVKSNLFGGQEYIKDNLYSRIYYEAPQDVAWKRIYGGDLVLSRDWFTTRFTFIKSKVQQWDKTDGVRTQIVPDVSRERAAEDQTIYGVSMNVDYENWLLRSEFSVFDRSGYAYKANAYMLGVGYRVGSFTPMATVTRYRERNDIDPDTIQSDRGASLTLRYDLNGSSAIKLQFDRMIDRSAAGLNFVGSSKVISVSYDTVF